MAERYKIMVVAGEASGDRHAAKLIRAIRDNRPSAEFEFFGAGGPKMREAGLEAVVHSDEMSIVGLLEIGRALPLFLNAFRKLKTAADERRPDAVILVDFPDFNLRLAKSLKKRGHRVIYYISPQVWAWRQYRIRTLRKYVDLLITILPFEREWFAANGIDNVEYVGSPLAREVQAESSKEEMFRRHSIDVTRPTVALLPGSRHKELSRILPVMFQAAAILLSRRESLQFVVALSANRSDEEVEKALADSGITIAPDHLFIIRDQAYDALAAADAAAVTSGTATLEAGIIGTPMAIVYKTSTLNYKLLRPLISVDHFGLINLIAGERVAKELIQDDLTPWNLANEIERLLEPAENRRTRERLRIAAEKLGHGGASARAAKLVFQVIDRET